MSDPTKAVFLSYAREDTDAAHRIAEALRGFGVEVWFDQSELRGGDQWDQKIRGQIKACALFIPVISATTQSRDEAYFRLEWKLADDRSHLMAAGKTFIVPVVIDDTPEAGAVVPDSFGRSQWTRLPGGEPSTAFIEQVKRLLDAPRKPALKPDLPRPPTLPPEFRQAAQAKAAAEAAAAAKAKPAVPGWMWGVLVAVIAVAVAGMIFLRQSAPVVPPPAPAPKQATATVSSGAVAKEDKSIAVLPFTNMSEDKESGFFADGVHEDILTNLALIRELHVVSRTSVMPYRTTTKSMRQIAQELGVTYILEGSVRRFGNKVRVTGQLIHAATDEHVWAKNYDRDITDIFAIQSELSQDIAASLSAALSPQEKSLLDRRPTENLAAYDAYLKARAHRQRNQAGMQEFEPLLEEAVRLDPKFALAWAELASAMTQVYFNDVDRSPARLARAQAAIDTAVRLAPDDPDVIERLGDFYYYGHRDFERATEQYLRLAVLRPNDAAVFGSLGFIHRRQGRWAEALQELQRAAELEPRDLRYGNTLVQLLLGLDRYDEAATWQARIAALYPDLLADVAQAATIPYLARGSRREGDALLAGLKPGPADLVAAVYWRKQWARLVGDWTESIRLDGQQRYYDGYGEPHWSQDVTAAFVLWAHGDQAAARALATTAITEGQADLAQKPSPTAWSTLAAAHALVGNKTEALRCAQTAKDLLPESMDAVAGAPLSLAYAQVLAWTGDKDRAIAELARLLRTPFGENIHAAKYNPGWLPLHGDPRFEALLADPKNNQSLF